MIFITSKTEFSKQFKHVKLESLNGKTNGTLTIENGDKQSTDNAQKIGQKLSRQMFPPRQNRELTVNSKKVGYPKMPFLCIPQKYPPVIIKTDQSPMHLLDVTAETEDQAEHLATEVFMSSS